MARSRHRAQSHPYPRSARVNALIQEVIAEQIERFADADERLDFVTVTGVSCEPDLRHAVVLVSSLPEPAAVALEDHRRALQATLGKEVRLKRVPVLSFALDPAIEAGARVEEALRRAKLTAHDPGDDDAES
jgi:ribosome-binding factor A